MMLLNLIFETNIQQCRNYKRGLDDIYAEDAVTERFRIQSKK